VRAASLCEAYASHSTNRIVTKTIMAVANKYPNENHGLRLRVMYSLSVIGSNIRSALFRLNFNMGT
jgi:hypothetical protein